MAQTKAQRSQAAKKAAATRKRNQAKAGTKGARGAARGAATNATKAGQVRRRHGEERGRSSQEAGRGGDEQGQGDGQKEDKEALKLQRRPRHMGRAPFHPSPICSTGRADPSRREGWRPGSPLSRRVARVQAEDAIGFGLATGQPPAFLKALGERDDWEDLRLYGALLSVWSEAFKHPNVHYLSGFYGPMERMLRDSGANISFAPADFRRFGPLFAATAPRIMAAPAAPPDADGYCSLSLHAGGLVPEL